MAITNALASVAVKDLAKSAAWYQTLFGRVPDSTPMPELTEWRFERGGWLQVYELKERAGAGSVTLAVNSLEDQIAALHQIGIDPGKPMISEQVKVVMIKDPDGNSIAFAETIERVERPERYRNAIVPHIYVNGAVEGIAFYKRAFGAVELFRIADSNGNILHAEISICGSVLMIGDPDDRPYGEPRKLGGCTAGLHIFVDDNAALLRRAVEAGAEIIQPPTEMFYGANSASVRDPFDHVWVLLTWKEDLRPAEMERRGNALLSS